MIIIMWARFYYTGKSRDIIYNYNVTKSTKIQI